MFSEKLKEIRVLKKMRQETLAQQLNVKNTTISNWEKNVSMPDLNTLHELCKLLHVSADYLLEIDKELLTPQEQSFIDRYRKLDDYGKKAVNTTLELEYNRVISYLEEFHFTDFDESYAYLTKNPMFAMGGLDIESMDKEELIKFANDQYEMDQRAMKLFK